MRPLIDSSEYVVYLPCGTTKIGMRIDGKPAYEWDLANPQIVVQKIEKIADNNAVDRSRIYLTGISAGGQMAYVVGIEKPDLFAGLVCFSGFVNKRYLNQIKVDQAKTHLPMFVIHGLHDDSVSLAAGRNAANYFRKEGFQVKWKTFAGGHTLPSDLKENIVEATTWFGTMSQNASFVEDRGLLPNKAAAGDGK